MRIVVSLPPSVRQSRIDRVAWPTFRPRSQRKYSMYSTTRSVSGVGSLGGQKQQVDIAERRQHAAAVAAGRRDAEILDRSQFGLVVVCSNSADDNAIDQRPEKPRCLQAGDLLMLEGMLNIGLDTCQMAAERANGGISGNRPALLGEAGKSVREQGRRGFRGTRQGDRELTLRLIVLCGPIRASGRERLKQI